MLDNCEHLLDGCAVLAGTLTTSCPDLYVLATSRQALGVAGEVRMVVPPMSLPSAGDDIPLEEVLRSDAVWLLGARAALVVPGFTVDAGNAGAVLRLCQRLDDRERLLWARLSVFSGGFQPDAAAEVCGDARLPAEQIVDLLGALVEKSILKRQLRGAAPPRYWLLETMRQYGRDRLREMGEEAATQKRHFDWICGLARQVGAWDGRQAELFKRMYDERDNLWTALDLCARQPREVPAGAELAQNLQAYWSSRGPFGDVRRVLTSLACLARENSVPRARLLWVAAIMALNQNDTDACRALSDESLRIGTELKDVEVVGWSLLAGAIPRWLDGDPGGATEQIGSVVSLARLMRIDHVELNALNALCWILMACGEPDRAVDIGEQGLAISKERGDGPVPVFAARGHDAHHQHGHAAHRAELEHLVGAGRGSPAARCRSCPPPRRQPRR